MAGNMERTDANLLALGANTAAADAATPGTVAIGSGETRVSRVLNVRHRKVLSLFVVPDSGASITVNALGTPDPDAETPVALDGGSAIQTGITGATWVTIDVSVTPFVQIQLVEEAVSAGNVRAYLARQ